MLKAECPRCHIKNSKNDEYCINCGIYLAHPRPFVLKNNRWEPAEDELAVFFTGQDLNGIFKKEIYVPSGMRGFLLDGDRYEPLQEGLHPIEPSSNRIKEVFFSGHKEILIVRQNAVSVNFDFDDIPCAEGLFYTCEISLLLRADVAVTGNTNVGNANKNIIHQSGIAAFRSQFMTRPGVVTSADIRRLLNPTIKQLLKEFLSTQSNKDIVGSSKLREDISDFLLRKLQDRLIQLGLVFSSVDNINLSRPHYDQQKQKIEELKQTLESEKLKADLEEKLNDLRPKEQLEELTKNPSDGKVNDSNKLPLQSNKHGLHNYLLGLALLIAITAFVLNQLNTDDSAETRLVKSTKEHLYDPIGKTSSTSENVDEEKAYILAMNEDSEERYKDFLSNYPDSQYARKINKRYQNSVKNREEQEAKIAKENLKNKLMTQSLNVVQRDGDSILNSVYPLARSMKQLKLFNAETIGVLDNNNSFEIKIRLHYINLLNQDQSIVVQFNYANSGDFSSWNVVDRTDIAGDLFFRPNKLPDKPNF